MNKSILCALLFFLFFNIACLSQNKKFTSTETIYRNLFIEFRNYLCNCIITKADITDSTHLQFILKHYVFINLKQDRLNDTGYNLSRLNNCQLNTLKKTLNTFYQFLFERQDKKVSANLDVSPIRLCENTAIYNQMTGFQKRNTLVFFDKRNAKKILGYLLFFPSLKNVNADPKIWSWNLEFNFGKYLFTSLIGEEGYEYMFSPEIPKGNR